MVSAETCPGYRPEWSASTTDEFAVMYQRHVQLCSNLVGTKSKVNYLGGKGDVYNDKNDRNVSRRTRTIPWSLSQYCTHDMKARL